MNLYQLPTLWGRGDWEIGDPGNGGRITATKSGVCNLRTAGVNETRTLAAPIHVGQFLLLNFDTDGGFVKVTAPAAINVEGDNTILFEDVLDNIFLVAVTVAGVKRWCVPNQDTASAGTNGPTLSLV
jgi:hypothetical protein